MDLEKERIILKVGKIKDSYLTWFKICEAIWLYDGRAPEEPHALLASGKHSDGYINCRQILKFTNLTYIFARRIVTEKLSAYYRRIDYVVSSSMTAITFGNAVATYLRKIFIYTEKENGIQKLKGFDIPNGARILQVEDLITTLKTTRQVTQAVLEKNKNVEFVRDEKGKIIVLTLVHRPEKLPVEYPDYRILPLIELEIHTWKPKDCPLCQVGSKALPPKPNWELFLKYNNKF